MLGNDSDRYFPNSLKGEKVQHNEVCKILFIRANLDKMSFQLLMELILGSSLPSGINRLTHQPSQNIVSASMCHAVGMNISASTSTVHMHNCCGGF